MDELNNKEDLENQLASLVEQPLKKELDYFFSNSLIV